MGNQYKEWTQEEIVKAIKDFYVKYKRTPRVYEFLNKNNLPSYTYTQKVLNVNTIEEILDICGLERTETIYKNKIDKNWALEQLKKYYQILNRIPTREDFKNNNWKPHYEYYSEYFGGLKNAYYLIGLVDKPLSKLEKIQMSIDLLKRIANELQRCPTVYEYDARVQKEYCRRELEKKLNLKYNDICKKYIPEYPVNIDRDVPQEEIIKSLTEIYNILGRPPMYYELKKYGCNYSQTLIKSKFNMTYNQLIRSLGWSPTGTDTLKKTKEELLNDFYNLFIKYKRIPYFDDLNSNNNTASGCTYIKYFGSIKNVCELLNIDYEEYYKGAGAGKVCLDNNGEICKSLIERDISNFLILNKISFQKDTSYSELINNDKRKFDWKLTINNITYYVEYAGMYHRNPRGRIDREYIQKIRKKIKDLYKLGYMKQCLFIFPWDIKNKTLADIFGSFLKIPLLDIAYTYKTAEMIEYNRYTDIEILNIVMKYSNDKNFLPSSRILARKESGLYKEILKRYGSYNNFAKSMNKQTLRRKAS